MFAGIKTPKMKRDHKCLSMTTSVCWHKNVIRSVQVQVFVGIKILKMKRGHKCSSTSVRWHKDFENEV